MHSARRPDRGAIESTKTLSGRRFHGGSDVAECNVARPLRHIEEMPVDHAHADKDVERYGVATERPVEPPPDAQVGATKPLQHSGLPHGTSELRCLNNARHDSKQPGCNFSRHGGGWARGATMAKIRRFAIPGKQPAEVALRFVQASHQSGMTLLERVAAHALWPKNNLVVGKIEPPLRRQARIQRRRRNR